MVLEQVLLFLTLYPGIKMKLVRFRKCGQNRESPAKGRNHVPLARIVSLAKCSFGAIPSSSFFVIPSKNSLSSLKSFFDYSTNIS
jgi:hypothetical protein